MRRLLFAVLFVAPACTLFVKTSDLDTGAPLGPNGSLEAAAQVADATPEAADASADVRAFPDAATVWTNGHAYEVVFDEHIVWSAAKVHAESKGGHLATITSAEENAFVFSLAIGEKPANYEGMNGPWIGGIQTDRNAEPAGHWTWLNGDAWGYTAWQEGEPNDADETNGEQILGFCNGDPVWCDYEQNTDYDWQSYVIEYE